MASDNEVHSIPLSMESLAALNAMGPFCAISKASLMAFALELPDGVRYCTMPNSCAVLAFILLAVYINSFARAVPMSRGRRWVPYKPEGKTRF